jgi:hypothetical protein
MVTRLRASNGIIFRGIWAGYDAPEWHVCGLAGASFAAQRATIFAGHQLPPGCRSS